MEYQQAHIGLGLFILAMVVVAVGGLIWVLWIRPVDQTVDDRNYVQWFGQDVAPNTLHENDYIQIKRRNGEIERYLTKEVQWRHQIGRQGNDGMRDVVAFCVLRRYQED